MTSPELIKKYNVPGPRYTSYPTVPYWDEKGFTAEEWKAALLKSLREKRDGGISLYIHLPFCDSLCTFCGCTKQITTRHDREEPYIEAVLKEWKLYTKMFPEPPKIKEIHLGGGTPTFFSPENLENLMKGIRQDAALAAGYEFSFEAHPKSTSRKHLHTLYNLGFRRISIGVQDYDPKVQMAINRFQPFELVERVHEYARSLGYTSINHDLVYGLPYQTEESIRSAIQATNHLKPERISFYSYAHVPWRKGVGQRGFKEDDLPGGEEKQKLYELGRELLSEYGYEEIGMDHFALANDSLFKARQQQTLHRNFMGYTTKNTRMVIGLGMSAISDSWYAFSQNEKTVKAYQERVRRGELPVFRGHLLTGEDLLLREQILDIMCNFETRFTGDALLFNEVKEGLEGLEADGLVETEGSSVRVTEKGIPFVRNVAMAFDVRLKRSLPADRMFSNTV